MLRACDRCGKPYQARRRDSKWCGSTCRAANTKRPLAPVKSSAAELQSLVKSPLQVAVEAELSAAGRLQTAKGLMVVAAAERLSNSGFDTASGFAALLREFRACFDAALEGAKVPFDPLDEIRARRDRRLQ